jgi:hypothetical protein
MKHCVGKEITVWGGVIEKLYHSWARYYKSLLPATAQYKSHMKHCVRKEQGGVIEKLYHSRAQYYKSLSPATAQYKSHMKHCVGKEITVRGGVIESYITAGHGIIKVCHLRQCNTKVI